MSIDQNARACPAKFIARKSRNLLQKQPVPPDKSMFLSPLRVGASG